MSSLQQDTIGAERLGLAKPAILGDGLTEQARLDVTVCICREGIALACVCRDLRKLDCSTILYHRQ